MHNKINLLRTSTLNIRIHVTNIKRGKLTANFVTEQSKNNSKPSIRHISHPHEFKGKFDLHKFPDPFFLLLPYRIETVNEEA